MISLNLFESVVLYGIVFSISCFLIYIGQKGQKQFIPSRCLFLIALIIPSIIAGVRSESVGTDVMLYVAPTYYDMSNVKSIDEIEKNIIITTSGGPIEIGFVYLAYFSNKYLGHIGFFLGLIAFIQSLFVFLSLYSYRRNIPIYFGMFLYYCFYFLYFGFNIARQGLAGAICVFAVICLLKRKNLKFFIFMLLAVLFHKTAIIMFAILFLFWYSNRFTLLRHKIIFLGFFLGMIFFVQSQFGHYMALLEYTEKYQFFLESRTDDIGFKYKSMLVYIPIVILIFNKSKLLFLKFREFNFLSYALIFTVFTPFLVYMGNEYTRRIGEYFYFFIPLIFAMGLYGYKRYAKRLYINIFAIVYCFLKLFLESDKAWFSSNLLSSAS